MKPPLLATLEYPPDQGGIARYLRLFVEAAGAGAVEVLAGKGALLRPHGPLRWMRAVRAFAKRKDAVRAIVVSHVLPIGTAAWLAQAFTRAPYAVFVHGLDLSFAKRSFWKRALAWRVLRGAALVAANSAALAREVERDFAFVKNVRVAHPPVDPALLARGENAPPIVERAPILLTVSRLVARKGHGRVLEALAGLRERGRLPEGWRYEIVGEGPERPAIEASVRALGLEPHVTLLGALEDDALADAYARAAAFVMPTVAGTDDREGFGLVYLEAGAFGVPSIATNQPGVDEAVLDGQTGFLVPEGDISALETAIDVLLNHHSVRTQYGTAAKARARLFTPERTFADVLSFLNAL